MGSSRDCRFKIEAQGLHCGRSGSSTLAGQISDSSSPLRSSLWRRPRRRRRRAPRWFAGGTLVDEGYVADVDYRAVDRLHRKAIDVAEYNRTGIERDIPVERAGLQVPSARRRDNVPAGLREKGCEAPVYFRASMPISISVAGLLRLAFSGFGFAPERIAAAQAGWITRLLNGS